MSINRELLGICSNILYPFPQGRVLSSILLVVCFLCHHWPKFWPSLMERALLLLSQYSDVYLLAVLFIKLNFFLTLNLYKSFFYLKCKFLTSRLSASPVAHRRQPAEISHSRRVPVPRNHQRPVSRHRAPRCRLLATDERRRASGREAQRSDRSLLPREDHTDLRDDDRQTRVCLYCDVIIMHSKTAHLAFNYLLSFISSTIKIFFYIFLYLNIYK